MSNAVLVLDQVLFKVSKKEILKDVSLTLSQGKTLAVIGHNGAGKTTLFHLILGLKFTSKGKIKLFDLPCENPLARMKVGYVSERPYLNDHLTLLDTLQYFGHLAKLKSDVIKAESRKVIELVGLEHVQKQKLKTFSKGMLQRTLIAQALLSSPELLIMDEPMSGLDPEGRGFVKDLIIKLRAQGKTILFSTHTLEDVDVLADDILALDQGTVQFLGSVAEWRKRT